MIPSKKNNLFRKVKMELNGKDLRRKIIFRML